MKITTLPEEIYDKIFEKLEPPDLNQCQRVCRAWRSSAHIAFLQEINIKDVTEIEAFIRAIDYNPESPYLNAVKKITVNIAESHDLGIYLDEEAYRKLFFRFPNLTDVFLEKCLDWFEAFDNQRFCAEFLECCPKLESFCARGLSHLSYWHLRHLLTTLSVNFDVDPSIEEPGEKERFISSFPRLKELNCDHDYFDTLKKILPVLEHAPALTYIGMSSQYNNNNFNENYLNGKSEQDKAMILNKLSKIKSLYLEYYCYALNEGPSLETMQFIKKYMTGLTSFIVVKQNDYCCGAAEAQPVCSKMLELVDSPPSILHIRGVYLGDLPVCFPFITNKIFANTSTANRVLCVDADNPYHSSIRPGKEREVLDDYVQPEFVHLQVGVTKRFIKLDFPQRTASCILHRLFTSEINNVDVFKLVTRTNIAFEYLVDEVFFTNILNKMPKLKEAILDIAGIPRALIPLFQKKYYPEFEMIVNKHMEKITLRVKQVRLAIQLLDRLVDMYPNLEQLNLYYFFGIWDDSLSEFRLDLHNYKLNSLGYDLTVVKYKMLPNQQFIIIKVETLHKIQLFKVCRYFSSYTPVLEENLIDILASNDHIWVHIVITELKQLELWTYNTKWKRTDNNWYLNQDIPDNGLSLEENALDSRLLKHLIIPIE